MKRNKRITLILILSIIFILLALLVYTKEILNIDTIGYNLVVKRLRTDNLTTVMKFITDLADYHAIMTLSIITCGIVLIKNKRLALMIPTNMLIIATINKTLKHIFTRNRPTGYRLIDIGGYSFPSGHAMVSICFYGFLIFVIHKQINNKILKYFLTSILLLIIILIGISRIYLGVHYTSDVLAGYILSIIYLLIITKLLDKYV